MWLVRCLKVFLACKRILTPIRVKRRDGPPVWKAMPRSGLMTSPWHMNQYSNYFMWQVSHCISFLLRCSSWIFFLQAIFCLNICEFLQKTQLVSLTFHVLLISVNTHAIPYIFYYIFNFFIISFLGFFYLM